MSAAVLSVSEQKEAISGKKKKKKTMKNVLGIPANLKLQSQCVEAHETEKLYEILERLLPSARLPIQEKSKSSRDSCEDMKNDLDRRIEIKNKRNQLSLGVNALSRSIKKELISAALLASDIQPKFLVHHLNLLCNHNRIPCLHFPGLRNITKNNLGFPCIALGFKKNFSDFSEAIEEIKTISENKKNGTLDTTQKSPVESNVEESEKEEVCNATAVRSDETKFTYLLRCSTKERIFVPEKCKDNKTKVNADFIVLGTDDEIKDSNNEPKTGISSNLIRKRKSVLEKIIAKNTQADDDDDDDDEDEKEDLEVPKKKKKKEWVIDKVGTRPTYYPAMLMRVPSNPDRNRKK